MRTNAALAVTAFGLFLSADALACRAVFPDPSNPPSGSSAFLGVISGVHLQGLENRLLNKPDGYVYGMPIILTGGASPVRLRAVPLAGPAHLLGQVQELAVAQCRQAPLLGTKAVFIVEPGGKAAQLVLESESLFERWAHVVERTQHGR